MSRTARATPRSAFAGLRGARAWLAREARGGRGETNAELIPRAAAGRLDPGGARLRDERGQRGDRRHAQGAQPWRSARRRPRTRAARTSAASTRTRGNDRRYRARGRTRSLRPRCRAAASPASAAPGRRLHGNRTCRLRRARRDNGSCRSSNDASLGRYVQSTSSTAQPSPAASDRARRPGSAPSRSRSSQASFSRTAIFPKIRSAARSRLPLMRTSPSWPLVARRTQP